MILEFDMANPNAFEEVSKAAYEQFRGPVTDAAVTELGLIVRENFGATGVDRPLDWPSLNPRYAQRKHGGDVTPTLILTGALRDSIVVNLGDPDNAYVTSHNELAAYHQYGGPHLPMRPMFPMDDNGVITPYTVERVTAAAQKCLDSL